MRIWTEIHQLTPASLALRARSESEGETEPRTIEFRVKSSAEVALPQSDDWALLAWLTDAMYRGEDIFVDEVLSARFLNQVNATIRALLASHPVLSAVSVRQSEVAAVGRAGVRNRAVGFSGGVDSYATLLKHKDEDWSQSTHLAHFNVGTFGSTQNANAASIFERSAEAMKCYARRYCHEWITLDSNFGEFDVFDTRFVKTFSTKNASAILGLDGFIDEFHVSSSGNPVSSIGTAPTVGITGPSNMEPFIFPMISNERLSIVSAMCEVTRIEKIKMISQWPETYARLDVCTRPAAKRPKTRFRNCGHCQKCGRTLLTLDAIGALESYAECFDLDQFRDRRDILIEQVVLSASQGSKRGQALLELLKSKEFPVPGRLSVAVRRRLRRIIGG